MGNQHMNLFRFTADMMHLVSIIVLLRKIYNTKSCRGVSLRTLELYAIVFSTRYLDLFTTYVSLYVSVMKIIFLASTFTLVYLIRRHRVIKQTYDKDYDTFRVLFLIIPCALLAMLIHDRVHAKKRPFFEILWTFSIYLESVAILPQLVLLQRTQNIDNLTSNYIFMLGSYRALYILNWIYRYLTEKNYKQVIVWVSGIVQTIIYSDFLYYYIQSWQSNKKLKLPA